jgi:hypothetical protein
MCSLISTCLVTKIQWSYENLVHLKTSLKHKALDFCLQLTSSMRVDLSKSLNTLVFLTLSSVHKALSSSTISRSHNSSKKKKKKLFPSLYIVKHHLIPTFHISFQGLELSGPNETRRALKVIRIPSLFHLIHKTLRF